jgi:ferric-dicitrate binding protein FerR (iron transport regulator)
MTHSLLVRGASFALSVSLLLPALAAAAGSAPLGTLRSEGAVYVDSSLVPAQSSLFSGDRVATADGRASISLAHGSSVLLDRASSVALSNTLAGLRVGLVKGRVTFNSNPQAPVQVETAGLTVVAAGKFPSLAEVAMLADGSVSLAVHRGTMLVRSGGDEPAVVTAGKTITVGPQAVQNGQEPGTAAHGSKTAGQKAQGVHLSHGASMVLIGGIVVATAAAIAIPLAINNDETPASPAAP